jgi:hypothetical protein
MSDFGVKCEVIEKIRRSGVLHWSVLLVVVLGFAHEHCIRRRLNRHFLASPSPDLGLSSCLSYYGSSALHETSLASMRMNLQH